MTFPIVGFAGLTHLGINSQAAAAAHGFSTVGFHPDSELTEQLSQRVLPIAEPGLSDLFDEHTERLAFASDCSILGDCDLVYVSVDVPTDSAGQSDLSPIRGMIDKVLPVLKANALLIILSQVPPGFTRQLPVPPDRLYYQVETLILGCAVERAMYPERFIIGCQDPDRPLPVALETVLATFKCPVLPMHYESAELTKIAINMCLVASVSVANTMADLCEHIGADWNEIVPALKLDRRIGEYAYLKPGLGITGGNLERDLATAVKLADQTSSNAKVVKAWIADSNYRRNWVLRKLGETVLKTQTRASISVLGLAYKENTTSTKNSASISLLTSLTAHMQMPDITVYDPQVCLSDTSITTAKEAEHALAACRGVQAVVIMTPWPEFKALAPIDIAAVMCGEGEAKWLFDPYRVLEPGDCEAAGLRYITLGRAVAEEC